MANDKFHQRFNIDLPRDEAERRFINRAHNLINYELLPGIRHRGTGPAKSVENFICLKLGEMYKGSGCLPLILGDNLLLHLRTLEALYEFNAPTRTWANDAAKRLLHESELDLGIRWKKGRFLPSGSRLLDQKLVDDVLGILQSPAHEGALNPFVKGLEHFLHSRRNPARLSDVVTDMHESLEALGKIVLGNDKDLSANREAFVSKLKLSEPYNRMLKEYIGYANDARHAGKRGEPKPVLSRREVEAFIYQTGLFLRLALSEET